MDKKKIHDVGTAHTWSSDGDLPSIEECQSVLKPSKGVDAKLFIDGIEITHINADILKNINTEG